MSKINRSISAKDTSILIANAGGRCSFNFSNDICNKVLADGRVNLGERAHIIGVSGPRSESKTNDLDLNGYENLIWLCKDHHTIIDHPSNLNVFTVAELHNMKYRHEQRVRTGRLPYFGTETSVQDYASLSTLFLYLDIHALYGNVATFPKVHINFYDVGVMHEAYCTDNPPSLSLFDPLLRDRFDRFINCYYDLANHLRGLPNIKEEQFSGWMEKQNDQVSYQKVIMYLESVEALISIIDQRFPQILQQDVYKAFD
jgi:hypothetical protein